MTLEKYVETLVEQYGGDILSSDCMQAEKKHIQHGCTSIFEHSYNVACLSLYLAFKFHIDVNKKNLVRGALLHDYFMYDWHTAGRWHNFHGFTHAKCALRNASRDFDLNAIEKNIIVRHMFPLNLIPPKHKEGFIVCIADKISAVAETFSLKIPIFN
ncbi:MAG TPA: phosphohydrolase [Clostridiales bacterium]|jgi:uncharacterized protein|uniref:HD domain-containing protein n=1 Tax=Congzhengia minquanensis TaxID=2763657 RepID=A0A926DNJ4_9FIRM|nr:HD domain-containing protein [Congzhengia minquanensis]MBC8541121.1 HD domain-containing protein [Congzhengia minquanensis]MBD8947017.1 HD domain-containing protein [Clostridiales bacterium]HBL81022.1 phosphohydrolase [Clostridiales bacterium]